MSSPLPKSLPCSASLPPSRPGRTGRLPGAAAGALLLPPPAVAEAAVQAAHVAATVAAVVLVAVGALATASLLAYSPARFGQLVEERGLTGPARSLARRDHEYLVVAAAYGAFGWVLGLWGLSALTPAGQETWTLAGFALLLVAATSLLIGLAQVKPERSVLAALPWLHPVWLVLRWPVVLPILGVTRLLVRLVGPKPEAPADAAEVQKQVLAAVADTVTGNALAPDERTWIGNIVGLKELQISTLMTPRPDIVGLPDSMTLRDAVGKALEHGFSRYPVYHDRIDEVVGVFYVKDALRLMQDDPGKLATTPLRSLLREVLFAPETSGAAQLLKRFQSANQHLAIVIDEYGTTVGLVTVEDVLEQIVGDIGDEYDSPPAGQPEGEQIRVVEAGRVLELPGRATAAQVNELLGSELPVEGDWETLAGLVIARLNHIPAVDETVVVDGVEFRVLQADERRIRRLRATLLSPQPAEGRG